MKTLNNTHIGQIYYIHKIIGKNQAKLRDLGMISDKKITLISTDGENAIVKVDETRLALSSEFCHKASRSIGNPYPIADLSNLSYLIGAT